MFHRILVPLDGSELAEKSLDPVEQLAQRFESEVILIRVVVPKLVQLYGYAGYVVDEVGDRPEVDRYLAEVSRRLQEKGLRRVETVVRLGDAAEQIVDYAGTSRVDLIAMTTHGRTGIGRWLFGSVAEKVLQGATTALLVLRSSPSEASC